MNPITAKEFLIATVLVSVFVGFSFGIECYFCDPLDKKCHDPANSQKGVKPCSEEGGDDDTMSRVLDQERNRVDNRSQITYICAALKVVNENNSNLTGVYRTCLVNTTKDDHCDILKDEFRNDKIGNVVSCKYCNESFCNSWTMDAFKNSSPESFTTVLLYTFISCFFVLFVI